MGKSTKNVVFSIAMLNYRRVNVGPFVLLGGIMFVSED
jgi:hypothetical protein